MSSNFKHVDPPWYRDVKILNILLQIVFAIVFIGGIGLAFYSLTTNLKESGVALDFGVYKRPFGPAISEGISASQPIKWLDDPLAISNIIWAVWLVALNVVGWSILPSTYRRHVTFILLTLVLLFTVFGYIKPPREWALWLGLLEVAAWLIFAGYELRQKTFMFEPSRIRNGLLVVLVALIALVLVYPPINLAENLAKSLPESPYFFPNSITRAIITGIYNTLRVVVMSIIASTLVGIFVGIGLLSKNYLARNISRIYVEIFRNTPLLVQLFFTYAVLTTIVLPAPRQSIFSPSRLLGISLENNLYALNNRGVYLTKVIPTDDAVFVYAGLLIGLGAAWLLRRWRLDVQTKTGVPAMEWFYTLPVFIACVLIGWGIAGQPFKYDYPFLEGPNIKGGTQWSIPLFALFVGLTGYTSAFIADIVRAGIQSVPYGQIEAARSQGFSAGQVLGMVVLPQALRLIIPPLGNQYVNVGKNSSLAIAVGYVDTFRVIQLANNESGQAVPLFLGAMLLYLFLSITLSVFTNFLNQFSKVKTR